jgi:pantoate--beta-alanine ligase
VIIVETIAEMRAACDASRMAGMTVGFVPTMGFFHEGHRSLMRAARAANDFVVVSLFVNPTQFAPTEDLSSYPRDPDGDAAAAEAEGVDVLFVPTVSEMYPGDAAEPGSVERDGAAESTRRGSARTTVHVDGLTTGLCAGSRPTHFDGVTTVVAKLFSIVGPCRAYFGRKDAQQLAVVRRMATDLDLPVDVVGCPLVREPDGLAMSSRNAYLTADGRRAATVLSRALFLSSEAVAAGERNAAVLRGMVVDTIASEPAVRLDYAEVVDAHTLEPVARVETESLVAVAAFVGATRLIDNVTLSFHDHSPAADLGVLTSASLNQEH